MDIQQDKYASWRLLANALEEKGYTVEFSTQSPAVVTFTSPEGGIWKTQASHIAYPFNSQLARDTSIHKDITYQMAREAGFSVPFTIHVSGAIDDEQLEELLGKFEQLIVKPSNASLSRGLTLDITSLAGLRKAIEHARAFSSSVLIQQQVKGDEIRFTVINGKVEAAIHRQTPRVVGDGHSSIAELIRKENEERKILQAAYIRYRQLHEGIIDKKFIESNIVPGKGVVIELNQSTLMRNGASMYDVLPSVHESYILLVENLVKKIEAGFIVVDVFCEDYTQPATPNNYWLMEFNSAPVLNLYYSCRDGKQFDIVARLADTIDHWLHRSKD